MQLDLFDRTRLMARSLALLACLVLVGQAWAAPSRDKLTLLIPDNASLSSWQVRVWIDAAAEEGLQITTLTDTAFLALGANASQQIAGLVLPDSAHIQASDALVAAVKTYVSSGGRLMLTYDAAALTDAGFYALSGKSRFSDMVGVDYVQYEALRDRVVGFGPIIGTKGRLDNLSLPPGKYMPYTGPTDATNVSGTTSKFVPTSRFDPGGSAAMRAWIEQRAKVTTRSAADAMLASSPLRYDVRVPTATRSLTQLLNQWLTGSSLRKTDDVSASAVRDGSASVENLALLTPTLLAEADKVMQTVTGYGFGALGYYQYVTTGTFPGNVFLSSPEHGLVAGERSYGNGKLLFVNLPLGYFKAIGTDGALMHGFLNHFARDQVGMPRLSVQPKGVGGLVYNWHVDDGDDILPDFKYLMAQDFMRNAGPFSVHFTAGPDVVTLGDGKGMNLPNNPAAQDVVRQTGQFGAYANSGGMRHEIGSHGGWNHDLFGLNATEANSATYLPWVLLNFDALEKVVQRPLREYSAPVGNNPLWATQWLERHGVVGMYSVSNTGSAATREWRGGERVTSKLWALPIAPLGKAATFEEYEENGITNNDAAQWLIDLQSFVTNNRTNRLFYNHPPGARSRLPVIKTFVNRAALLQALGRFRWYTMAEIADFSERRIRTTWSSSSTWGISTFVASNPVGLTDVTWMLPRSRYNMPLVTSGSGTVSILDSTHWLVTANAGTSLSFIAGDR